VDGELAAGSSAVRTLQKLLLSFGYSFIILCSGVFLLLLQDEGMFALFGLTE